MTKEEFDKKMKEIKQSYESNKNLIYKEYAVSNNPYKVGDVVEDHYQKIKIEKITFYVESFSKYPECIYRGILLKKDNTPRKDGKIGAVYQSNIKK